MIQLMFNSYIICSLTFQCIWEMVVLIMLSRNYKSTQHVTSPVTTKASSVVIYVEGKQMDAVSLVFA